jgi:hypothetical protein
MCQAKATINICVAKIPAKRANQKRKKGWCDSKSRNEDWTAVFMPCGYQARTGKAKPSGAFLTSSKLTMS